MIKAALIILGIALGCIANPAHADNHVSGHEHRVTSWGFDGELGPHTAPTVVTGPGATRITIIALVGMILTLLAMSARTMIVESAQLRKSNVQLRRYFSANLVRRLSENPAPFRVGDERKELSFVFTDLEGFTSLVETNEPSVVVPLLNGYLDELVQVAFRHEGTVDNIVGDAVHVIFGAPVTQPDHAERAVACALEMDAVAERYRKRLAPDVAIGVTRIGVNSGLAIVGDFGGDALLHYTAHGDAINIAARLEDANKYLGTRICVSAETASRVRGFHGRPVGTLWLKGKSEGTDAFEPLPDAGIGSSALQAYLEAYELLRVEHPSVLEHFTELCKRYPKDSLGRFHLNRLKAGQSGTHIMLGSKYNVSFTEWLSSADIVHPATGCSRSDPARVRDGGTLRETKLERLAAIGL